MANPKLIPVPFANTGTKTTIPVTRASNDAAEMPDYDGGFPPITSTPLAAGGKAPRRPDFNGILNDITANIRHLNAGGFFTFDAAFAAKIGGYPKGAVLLSNDGSKKYVSLIDGNTSDFNVSVDATKWAKTALTEREIQDIAWGTNTISAPWAPLESPALTGMPTAPTAATGTNTTQVATTAFVNAEIEADRPFESTLANIKMDGAQSVGSLNTVARGDHVHPTDTSRAPLASPALTGVPTAPTASTGTRSTQLATTAFVGAESQIAAPVGSVYTFAGSTVPTGWLKCNGALLSRTTYAALFAVIGTTYGAGDGSTTFALPDLRGEFVRGVDDGRGVDAGRVLASFQQSTAIGTSVGQASSGPLFTDVVNVGAPVSTQADFQQLRVSFSPVALGATRYAIQPRNIAMHFIIKY